MSAIEYVNQAVALFEQRVGHPEKIALVLEKANLALKLDDQSAEAYAVLGDIYFYKSQLQEARTHYEKSIALNPRSDTYASCAMVYSHLHDYDTALKYNNLAIELDPCNADAYFQRAQIYDKNHKYDFVIQDCLRALQLSPLIKWTYDLLAETYCKINRYDLALEILPFVDSTFSYFLRKDIEEHYPLADIENKTQAASKLNRLLVPITETYNLSFPQAKLLLTLNPLSQWWLLQGWRQVVTQKTLRDEPVEIFQGGLPLEIWCHIFTFIVGDGKEDMLKLRKVASQQLRDNVIAARPTEKLKTSLNGWLTLFQFKKFEKATDPQLEARCQKRMNF